MRIPEHPSNCRYGRKAKIGKGDNSDICVPGWVVLTGCDRVGVYFLDVLEG